MNTSQASRSVTTQAAAASMASAQAWVAMQFQSALQAAQDAADAQASGAGPSANAHAWRAASMVQTLQMTLDMQRGGELARQLSELFAYLQRRLRAGQADASAYTEVHGLLDEVCQAWRSEPSLVSTKMRASALRMH